LLKTQYQILSKTLILNFSIVNMKVVSRRLTFHTMSDKVKAFVAQGLLEEGHLREIITCVAQPHLSPVDIWAEYARLKSLGWTQQRIAKAKGVSQGLVSERLRLHDMTDKVKGFITEGKVSEENLREIIQLLLSDNLHPWISQIVGNVNINIADNKAKLRPSDRITVIRRSTTGETQESIAKDFNVWQGASSWRRRDHSSGMGGAGREGGQGMP